MLYLVYYETTNYLKNTIKLHLAGSSEPLKNTRGNWLAYKELNKQKFE